ncbi:MULTISPECIES: hypothetical protein [Paraburkholderia]|jgi:hypothetical protein|uniref:Uncharacterized protein n=1 Tax=Paraburkholderia phenazinium TaxID=60549 RepID=A0A1N6EK16_9BURK|nr:hypothetical protein [Paraburkholderia phenazinium]SIN83310.1 hypothetical protein SAMN05444168_0728 [Paraburkholderia phenazinium]
MSTTTTNVTGELLSAYASFAVSNSNAVSRIGARAMVLCRFFDATLPQLTAAQCDEITRIFRHGVNDTMSITDDVEMPSAYHTALLEQTNALLAALEEQGSARR